MPEPRTLLGDGAAQGAPTAPHATPRSAGGKATGPERFWKQWPVRLTLAASLVVSGVAHCAVFPLDVPRSFVVNDVEGEAAIPVDVLSEEEPAPPPPPEPPPPAEVKPEDKTETPAALPPHRRDAGAPVDASPDSATDAGDAGPDARPFVFDAGVEGSFPDGAVPLAEGGAASPSAGGPRDPQAIIGAAGAVQADVVLVMLVVNADVIRTNPVGAKMGYLLRGIPQWDEFMSGTDIAPGKATDWLVISGPSRVNTGRDIVMIRYSASDATVDKAVDVVSRKYDKGGPWDAGVPGVKATLAHADRFERVLLRPQPHVLAVVPTGVATRVARQLSSAKVPASIRPGEAVYLRLVNPHHPMPEIPETITELRLRVVPRSDQGADVFLDGDTKDAQTALDAASDVRGIIKRHNGIIVASRPHGLLDGFDVTTEGTQVKGHLGASRDQIETLMVLVGDFLGVKPPGPVTPPGAHPTASARPH